MSEKILLADGNNIIHRAYHALPPMNNRDGIPTNAVSGFMQTLLRAMELESPDYVAVAFDLHGPTFRHVLYPEYKGQRPPTPEDLRPQFDWVKQLLAAMGIAILSVPEYEADDMLGTYSRAFTEKGGEAVLLTGDKDAFQLVGNGTRIDYLSGKGETENVDNEYLLNRYGLTSDKITDLKGLMGDPSDNIPGVPGVGEKTALKLLTKYGTLENVLSGAETGEKGALREKILKNADMAVLSKKLTTIDRNAPMPLPIGELRVKNIRGGMQVLAYLGLRRIAARLDEMYPEKASDKIKTEEIPQAACEELQDEDELRAWAEKHAARGGMAAYCFTDKVSAADANSACSAMLGGDLLSAGMDEIGTSEALQVFLEGRECVVTHDIKKQLLSGIKVPETAFDTMLAAYCADPQKKSFSLIALTEDISAGTDAQKLLALAKEQQEELKEGSLEKVFSEIEMPLARVLADMEKTGFQVDKKELERLGAEYDEKIAQLGEAIAKIAGNVNVNSPKQLGVFLFETLGLPAGKKTSSGYSTDAETLEGLLDKDETGVIANILEYRKYRKLKSTYIDALLRLQDEKGRIHTSFDQTATATGRISSNEPNLQNIPVRSELGKEIRRAFVAKEGCVLVDADYSQIELRVLAHMSGDEVMIDAFRKGQDIHARTAAEVYGVSLEAVTKEMRTAAKAVNFGIVYGISDFGLARNIGVSRREASEFIKRYFERYPGIKRYMDSAVEEGRSKGYAETMFGRKRYLPELSSPNRNIRSFGERCAMNSPIQGTSADIIKIAMIRVDKALREEGLEAQLILQVHDELIIEAPVQEAERVSRILSDCMENVATLDVPLVVECTQGGSWYACK